MTAPITCAGLMRALLGRGLLYAPVIWLSLAYGDHLSSLRPAAMMVCFGAVEVVGFVRFRGWLYGNERPTYWAYLERGAWALVLTLPLLILYAMTSVFVGGAFGAMIVGVVLYTTVPFYTRWKVQLARPGELLLRRGWKTSRVSATEVRELVYDRWSGWVVLDDGRRYPLADDLSAATLIGARPGL